MFKKRSRKRARQNLRKAPLEKADEDDNSDHGLEFLTKKRNKLVENSPREQHSENLQTLHAHENTNLIREKAEEEVVDYKKTSRYGPRNAPSHIRVTSRFDYHPEICKDYKETGYCGYGDTCKFIHDRSDYKLGWEIEREWELEQRKKLKDKLSGNNPEKTVVTEEVKKDVCFICKKDYQDKVITKCGHHFCQECALNRFLKERNISCAVCGASTDGTFNKPQKKR
eukprot:augustus_masked-scaffold_13-processed-gene-4.9-mRNA-1 protein AED:0.13 eAED:0.13 QI:0/-1/0/1/-1/1/1/0/225